MDSDQVSQGMYDADGTLLTQGFISTIPDFTREDYYPEHFHLLPFHKANVETIRIQEELEPGESKDIKVRGAGHFGCFYKGAVSEQADWRVRIYTDNDKQTLLAEFTG